ncbi:MAG: hypothetical protein AAGD35_03400 [Actinomycetota bacterium]
MIARLMPRGTDRATLLLALALLVTGCSARASAPRLQHEAVGRWAVEVGADGDAVPDLLAFAPPMTTVDDGRRAEILGVTTDVDGASLTVTFEMGPARCDEAAVTIDETDNEVAVAVWARRRPDADPLRCGGVHRFRAGVALDAPVDGRPVVVAEADAPAPHRHAGLPLAPGGDTSVLLGLSLDDAVDWARSHRVDWRVAAIDGIGNGPPQVIDRARLALYVADGRVVGAEWS